MKLRIFTEPQQGASYEQLLAVARCAEECGFDAFFRSDHYLRMGEGDARPGPTDAWITLAGLARDTSRIRLGTLLSAATFRLPAQLAVIVAQVDAMSGGRVELGLGAGWFEEEHRAFGIPFPPSVGGRFDRLEEQLEIVTGMWATAEDDRYSFAGAHYQVVANAGLPKPAQVPRVAIIVGGKARDGPRRSRPALPTSATSRLPLPSTAPRSSLHLTPLVFGSVVTHRRSGDQPRSWSAPVATTTRSELGQPRSDARSTSFARTAPPAPRRRSPSN